MREGKKSPGTTSEERLIAEARGRCRSCTSEPAISCVVTRDSQNSTLHSDCSSTDSMPGVGLANHLTFGRSLESHELDRIFTGRRREYSFLRIVGES